MQPRLWHHHLPHADWRSHASSWSLSSLRRYDDTARQCSGGCAHPRRHGSSGWEKHRKMDGRDCKWPFLLAFSALLSVCVCVCVRVCVSVSVCESVREEGTFSSQPPAARAFTGETRQPDLFCFLLERKGKGRLCVFLCQFFQSGS